MGLVTIKIGVLFPTYFDLYGDNGNVLVLNRYLKSLGLCTQIVVIEQPEDIEGCDVLLMGGGSYASQGQLHRVAPAFGEKLRGYFDLGGVGLFVCAGFQFLGSSNEKKNGLLIPCSGAFDFKTYEAERRMIGPVVTVVKLDESYSEKNEGDGRVELVGFENHLGATDIGSFEPFGRVCFGFGNDESRRQDGMVYRNLIATYFHGPVLALNYDLAFHIIKRIIIQKGLDPIIEKSFKVSRFAEETKRGALLSAKK